MSPAARGDVTGPQRARPVQQSRRRRRWLPYLLLAPGLGWLAVFFAVPLVTLVATSLYDPSGSLATGYAMTWHFANYVTALSSYTEQFVQSLIYAGIAAGLALLVGYPLAYTIAFKAGRWKNVLLVLVIAPFFTSFLVRTLAWTTILADTGWVAQTLRAIGLLGANGRLLATPIAVVLGLMYNFLPFTTLPLYAALERIDHRLIEVAEDLYASSFSAFRRVTLPLSMPGVVAGSLLTFIPAAGDFINAALLGTPDTYMVGNVIKSQFLRVLDYPTAAALSVSLMVTVVVLVTAYVRKAGTEDLI